MRSYNSDSAYDLIMFKPLEKLRITVYNRIAGRLHFRCGRCCGWLPGCCCEVADADFSPDLQSG